MHKTISKTHHKLYHDLDNIKSALEKVSGDIRDEGSEFISRSFDHIKEKSLDARDDLSGYVSKRPLKALSIALVVGAILGLFFKK